MITNMPDTMKTLSLFRKVNPRLSKICQQSVVLGLASPLVLSFHIISAYGMTDTHPFENYSLQVERLTDKKEAVLVMTGKTTCLQAAQQFHLLLLVQCPYCSQAE